jgi:hypothetical protein
VTNFARRLPTELAGMAAQMRKDPYCFDFLGLGDEAHEREIEHELMRHIARFMLEAGSGFALLGRQMRLESLRVNDRLILPSWVRPRQRGEHIPTTLTLPTITGQSRSRGEHGVRNEVADCEGGPSRSRGVNFG